MNPRPPDPQSKPETRRFNVKTPSFQGCYRHRAGLSTLFIDYAFLPGIRGTLISTNGTETVHRWNTLYSIRAGISGECNCSAPVFRNPVQQLRSPDRNPAIGRTRSRHQIGKSPPPGFRRYPPPFRNCSPNQKHVGPPQRRTAPPAPRGVPLRCSRPGLPPPSFPRTSACHSTRPPHSPRTAGSRVPEAKPPQFRPCGSM